MLLIVSSASCVLSWYACHVQTVDILTVDTTVHLVKQYSLTTIGVDRMTMDRKNTTRNTVSSEVTSNRIENFLLGIPSTISCHNEKRNRTMKYINIFMSTNNISAILPGTCRVRQFLRNKSVTATHSSSHVFQSYL